MSRLEKKVAIVTGGSTGIGKGIVERFVQEHCKVVFCGRREEAGRQALDQLSAHADALSFFTCDTTDAEQVERLVQHTLSRFGKIDIAVANAGGAAPHAWPDDGDDNWNSVIAQNLGSMHHLCRAVWPHMVAAKSGAIVAISSLSAWGGIGRHQLDRMGGMQPNAAYQTSKAAMEGLVVHLAGRGGEHGIRVNAIRPGRILTDEYKALMGEDALFWSLYQDLQMLPQHGEAIDVANAAVFLASDEAKFITAEILDVNGGAVAKV